MFLSIRFGFLIVCTLHILSCTVASIIDNDNEQLIQASQVIHKTYHLHYNAGTFWQGWRACLSRGQRLATVTSASENQQLQQLIEAKPEARDSVYWIGGTDEGDEGDWVWIGIGSPIVNVHGDGYTNFAEGEPNNSGDHAEEENCLTIGYHGGVKWNDQNCTTRLGFVCEKVDSASARTTEN